MSLPIKNMINEDKLTDTILLNIFKVQLHMLHSDHMTYARSYMLLVLSMKKQYHVIWQNYFLQLKSP